MVLSVMAFNFLVSFCVVNVFLKHLTVDRKVKASVNSLGILKIGLGGSAISSVCVLCVERYIAGD